MTRLIHWREYNEKTIRNEWSQWHAKKVSRHTLCNIEYPRGAETVEGPVSAIDCPACLALVRKETAAEQQGGLGL